jgi:glycosyltransferase involved in cell wall biosynthesis
MGRLRPIWQVSSTMTPMRNPKLTVLTTVHNGERYLDETIASILAQDFADFEYVIVDDGSTDGTPELLRQWSARDSRIVLERIPHNAGIAAALNRGLAVARGEYIGKQDSDDVCVNGRLRAQVEILDRAQDVVLVSANYRHVDEHGRWAGNYRAAYPSAIIPYLMNFTNAVGGAGCQGMFRCDIARKLGGFCEEFEASIDYEFFTRLLAHGRFVVLPMVGAHKRIHAGQVSMRLQHISHRNARLNSRRLLTAYLQRDLSDEEFLAANSVWERRGLAGVADTAHRVMREAYARCATGEPDRSMRRRARRVTAGRWALSALDFLQRGAVAEAASHLVYSLRWHPLGFLTAVNSVAERLALRVHRRVRVRS